MCIACWMLLGLEEGIKVPERALNIGVGWHLLEAHFQKDLSESTPYFQQRMEMTTNWRDAQSVEVVFLEGLLLPVPTLCI